MAKEPMAGQPDEFDVEGFTNKLIDLLSEFDAEATLSIPDHIVASFMWNQAVQLSEVTEAYVDFITNDNEENMKAGEDE